MTLTENAQHFVGILDITAEPVPFNKKDIIFFLSPALSQFGN